MEEVKLERKDWEDMKLKAKELIRADMINLDINKLILLRCEEELEKCT